MSVRITQQIFNTNFQEHCSLLILPMGIMPERIYALDVAYQEYKNASDWEKSCNICLYVKEQKKGGMHW